MPRSIALRAVVPVRIARGFAICCPADLVKNETNAIEEQEASTGGADERFAYLLAKNNPSTIEAIRDVLSAFRDTRKRLMAVTHSWMNDAVRDIPGGNSSLWHELLRVTRYAITSVEEHVAVADDTNRSRGCPCFGSSRL
ncbi:MAG: hypothetical protein SWH68_05490 [Thermodesulfobacteriota bacterium]|nr:hypothetical protein [Thermodesulfobacteriota bacterium]